MSEDLTAAKSLSKRTLEAACALFTASSVQEEAIQSDKHV